MDKSARSGAGEGLQGSSVPQSAPEHQEFLSFPVQESCPVLEKQSSCQVIRDGDSSSSAFYGGRRSSFSEESVGSPLPAYAPPHLFKLVPSSSEDLVDVKLPVDLPDPAKLVSLPPEDQPLRSLEDESRAQEPLIRAPHAEDKAKLHYSKRRAGQENLNSAARDVKVRRRHPTRKRAGNSREVGHNGSLPTIPGVCEEKKKKRRTRRSRAPKKISTKMKKERAMAPQRSWHPRGVAWLVLCLLCLVTIQGVDPSSTEPACAGKPHRVTFLSAALGLQHAVTLYRNDKVLCHVSPENITQCSHGSAKCMKDGTGLCQEDGNLVYIINNASEEDSGLIELEVDYFTGMEIKIVDCKPKPRQGGGGLTSSPSAPSPEPTAQGLMSSSPTPTPDPPPGDPSVKIIIGVVVSIVVVAVGAWLFIKWRRRRVQGAGADGIMAERGDPSSARPLIAVSANGNERNGISTAQPRNEMELTNRESAETPEAPVGLSSPHHMPSSCQGHRGHLEENHV
ncbi:uncharacterized protein LOC120540152 [Polypterus senegalus]|uniref:uncharacterized protein LOC120540152 n=1 Tax=Polypterus senegalus TaxID=55291 RepID=UPI001964178E|nr:uncharacterized protein LOC120540152 [Polypterus senegalus]